MHRLPKILPGQDWRIQVTDGYAWNIQNWSCSRLIRSRKIQVPTASLAVNTVWVRVSRAVTRLARQKEVDPDTEGVDVSFVKGGTAVAPISRSFQAGRRAADCSTFTIHTETDCFPFNSERRRQFGPTIAIGQRRWFSLEYSERCSHGQKMISKQCTTILRSQPTFHDMDGACPMPNMDPRSTTEAWLERFSAGIEQSPFFPCWKNMMTTLPRAFELLKFTARDHK